LAAVDFDDQISLSTGKISEVRTDWKLPDEFEAVQSSVAKFRPEFCLGIIVCLPKAARAICYFRFWAAHLIVRREKPLTLTLSPQAGRGDASSSRIASRSMKGELDIILQDLAKLAEQLVDVVLLDDQWRRESDDVAGGADQ